MDELLAALARKGTIAGIADALHLRYPTVWAWYKLGRRPSRESMGKIIDAYSDLEPLVMSAMRPPLPRRG